MTILLGNALDILSTIHSDTIDCIITSPPYYGLRDYGISGQFGLEETPQEYVNNLVSIFKEAKRCLKSDGTLWLNLGDSYAGSNKGLMKDGSQRAGVKQSTNTGSVTGKFTKTGTKTIGLKPKDLIGIPWRVAFALQENGWYLRQDIIWNKPNAMPESVKDRCTKSHEYIFLLTKSPKYYFDSDAIKEPCSSPVRTREKNNGESAVDTKKRGFGSHCGTEETRNKRSVWSVTTKSFKDAHFATFPIDLIEPCVLAGCPENGVILDPFFGSGTTGVAAIKHNRKYIGIELNPEYIEIAKNRLTISLPSVA